MLAKPADRVANQVLILLHQPHSVTGRVGRLLQSFGCALDLRYPSRGDPLPPTLARHAGVVVFGGPMCANDDEPWLRREIDWLGVPLREGKPFLGLCLGAQLMARRLGARVHASRRPRGELGYHPLRPTLDADNLCPAPFPRHAYQWHFDGFDIPAGARRLAEGSSEYPEPGLHLRRRRRRSAVSPGGDVSNDLPLDHASRRPRRSTRAAH